MLKTTCLRCGKPFKECVCHSPDNWETTTSPWPPWETVTGDTGQAGFVVDDELKELVKALRNRCDTVLILIEHYGTED